MKYLIILLILPISFSCKEQDKKEILPETYLTEIEDYRNKLNTGRKNGYLQLTGLFKLDSLDNTFGKNSNNDFVFNVTDIPENIGTISMTAENIVFTPNTNIEITTKQDSVITASILNFDEFGSSVRMYHKHANWQVITRSGQKYLRVWDEKNPAIEAFKGFEFYALNSNFIIEGQFTYFKEAKEASVKSQLGVNANTNFIGQVSFNFDGDTHTLDVGSNGFTMVGDATTGEATYGGGRYVYLDLPETDGAVTIDFNKLYNPPCSFSKYTTCLYPPRQNHLPFEILAGETITKNK